MISPATRSQLKSRREFNLELIRALHSEPDARKRCHLRNRVLERNLGLVRRVCKKFSNTPQDESDFFSEGCLALIDALKKFDPERGFQFSTYATTCIRNRLFRLFRERDRKPVEVPLDPSVATCRPSADSADHHRLDDCCRLANAILLEMPQRERELVRLRFGLDGSRRSRSFREVAEEAGLSKERVRQLVNQAILSIQSNLLIAPGVQRSGNQPIHE